jgi:DNA polymerase-3 subunit epsilon
LCDRYGISNAHRTLHGALLDAELLAEVYLAMTRGQNSFTIDLGGQESASGTQEVSLDGSSLSNIIVLKATEEESVEHEANLAKLDKEVKGTCVWRLADSPAD